MTDWVRRWRRLADRYAHICAMAVEDGAWDLATLYASRYRRAQVRVRGARDRLQADIYDALRRGTHA